MRSRSQWYFKSYKLIRILPIAEAFQKPTCAFGDAYPEGSLPREMIIDRTSKLTGSAINLRPLAFSFAPTVHVGYIYPTTTGIDSAVI
jgi:hypothetical protein